MAATGPIAAPTGTRSFTRVAIVNRGEPAVRFLNAAREYAAERGVPLTTIALHTDVDRHAWFVRDADEAYSLGPASTVDPGTGRARLAYLDLGLLREALIATRAEAVWVGWGFVAEDPAFADLVRELGLVFIGPSPESMRMVGDKIAAKQLAEKVDVPVTPWSGGPVHTVEEAVEHGERIGFPLVVKATAGGGGRGIRMVDSPDALAAAFESARNEARLAFGDERVFMEWKVDGARHIEVQVAADEYGGAWAVGVRDCSVQRRNQKVMEESASTALSPETAEAIAAAGIRIAQATGYHGVGTIEFLYLPERDAFYFMEVNTRLQVEHTVTEATTGVDLVKLQLDLARGLPLPAATPPPPHGHAIELRLNAEDPLQGFAPSPGRLVVFAPPQGPGMRVDSGVTEGDVIPPEYDSMIAKIIAWGRDRAEAIARMRRALGDTLALIEGGTTNRSFLLSLLEQPDVVDGRIDTLWLDRTMAAGGFSSAAGEDDARAALLLAAIDTYRLQRDVERAHLFSTALRGRPELLHMGSDTIDLQYSGQTYSFAVCEVARSAYRVTVDGRDLDVATTWLGRHQSRLRVSGRDTKLVSMIHGETHMVESARESFRIVRGDAGVVRASSPGVVVSVAVAPGDEIAAGQTVMVVEAMKLESAVVSPVAGRVREVLAGANAQVDAGDPLLRIDVEADDDGAAATTGAAVSFAACPSDPPGDPVTVLRHRLLGYDADPSQSALLAGPWTPATDPAGIAAEDEALQIFVDVCSVTQRVPDGDEQPGGLEGSPEDHLATFMRSVERAEEVLPEKFLLRLRQVLARYGVTTLERGPALDDAVARVYNARLGLPVTAAHVVSLLRARLAAADRLRPLMADGFADLLDAITRVADGRFPGIAELARATRFRHVDERVIAQVRAEAYAEVERELDWLEHHPDSPERGEHIAAIIAVKPGVVTNLVERAAVTSGAARATTVQALLFRHYRARFLENMRTVDDDLVTADYWHHDRLIRLVGAVGPWSERTRTLAQVTDFVHQLGEGDVSLELFFWHDDALDIAESEASFRAALDANDFGRPIRRIVVTTHRTGAQTAHHFTYRQNHGDADSPVPVGHFAEQRLYRDLHPMIADRLELWRLQEFDLERQPADGGVYVFRGRARGNPGDERLFALAEVHDLTPITDERGRVTAYPEIERTFLEAVGAVRRAQLDDNPRTRLLRNRITLYVQPPWTLDEEVVRELARRLARAVRGSGLEQIVVRAKVPDPATGDLRDVVLQMTTPRSVGFSLKVTAPSSDPIAPQSTYDNAVLRLRRRGEIPPFELIRILTPSDATRADFPVGEFVEHDLAPTTDGSRSRLVPVDRPRGQNSANIVVGTITNRTAKHPEGMTRVILLGDPGRSLGSLAEPECRRIIAALDLAEELDVPVEWFAVSSGAKVAMDSGTENMDWTAAALRRIVEFTQAGREINVVVTGVNVGAQSYFDAEATMLMHTRGVLVMLPGASMVLTGKQSLDVSGGVSAEDNVGIGGFERVMGPNGQAQYSAQDIETACQILFAHYEHTYVAPGERFPRRRPTVDPVGRDVRESPHPATEGSDFTTVGDVFSSASNPDRKKPFDVRAVMAAVVDADARPLERWARWRGAEAATVWDAHVGGIPVALIGIESKNLRRPGPLPADGPEIWTAGTLFPLSSKKVARAINAASGVRPLVVLANLSGFDGSPESMRTLQLEYGAEIGRAVVNFDGPIVFCVVSRYHGGAFVVFSKALNENLEAAAVVGSKASVLGGAPAAAVVFSREVDARVQADPRIADLTARFEEAAPAQRAELRLELADARAAVRGEKLGELAAEFDAVHTVERAREVGSVDHVIAPEHLRPYLVDALERGMARTLAPRSGGRHAQ